MQGLELCEKFFIEHGQKLLEEHSQAALHIAVGVAGSGSECLGFDDGISQDHDFRPGFTIWLNDEDEATYGYELMRAYEKLPKEYSGVTLLKSSAFGQSKFGVRTISSFLRQTIGLSHVPDTPTEWMRIPEHALACAVNGRVFFDANGVFTAIRDKLNTGMPDDVYFKKLSAHLALCAQSGQYNFQRCVDHSETSAAQLAVYEFVNHWFFCRFMLEGVYLPFYKWRFRALRQFDKDGDDKRLEYLLFNRNTPETISRKHELIGELCNNLIKKMNDLNLTDTKSDYLENHAIELMSKIKDPEIKALHLLEYGANE